MSRKGAVDEKPPLRICEATWNRQHSAGRAQLIREAAVLGYRLTITCEDGREWEPDPVLWSL